MRTIDKINDGWLFIKNAADALAAANTSGIEVTLPHTWNAEDGQDGGNDYYRGTCWYVRRFKRPILPAAGRAWLEFRGVAMTAAVYLNGRELAAHKGGYSAFRVDITDALKEDNVLVVSADNSKNEEVYPQKADFTFYGGIYRDVYLITVPLEHFAMDYYGSPAIKVTPALSEDLKEADVTVEAWVSGPAQTVQFAVGGQTQSAVVDNGHAETVFHLKEVQLWEGLADPYLYTAFAKLDSGDEISTRFGCRNFFVDAQKGFFLNGRSYPLCGAARHQDRQGVGTALTPEMMEEDLKLMLEMGANTVRLAHYQHDQYFYDLCDEAGMVLWVEIPYITQHMANPAANENTRSQMRELVVQNYNHPSIVCWGLSNEITAAGGVGEDLVENHRVLNDLCHRLDKTRPTVMAHAFMLETDDPLVMLPDIRSYNLYFGWYHGDLEMNDEWFDHFHAAHPEAVIGLSEYGADANPQYQSVNPEKGDYTDSYQAVYHEHLLKMWSSRPYIWAMHCWNMFDFGADGRAEGGKPGQNQKGLVTFDRKVKKDAFYIYKAYLSREPFVYICGRRYVDRTEEKTEIKVYSNQKEVSLFADGRLCGVQSGDKIFRFTVSVTGEHVIEAAAGECRDSITIRRADKPNPNYSASRDEEVVNWFDKPEEVVREGYYSIMDTMEDIKKNPEAAKLLAGIMAAARKSYGDVAQGVKVPESVQKMMDRESLNQTLKQARKAVTPAMIKELNHALNQIKK
ncbi:glycoside hydrolase family 2 protein [Hungatella hathewayi]|uniref:glycoside hydrolase family 2 protein n=1 Tax=Hungatella hathewayi TaxID=154046 RepID=UPI003569CE3B